MKFYLLSSITFCLLLGNFSLSSQDLAALYSESIKSVVTIFSTEYKVSGGSLKKMESLGSGVIIDAEGLIMTAAHVIETANVIKVKLSNDEIYEAEIIRSIPNADIALIKIIDNTLPLEFATINQKANTVNTGNQIYIIGSPLGIERSLSSGYVSGFLKRNVLTNGSMVNFIQTDAAVNHGNSGGPMFDMKGDLIGIVSYILSQSGGFDGIGYAVDVQTAKKLLLEDDSYFWSGFDGYFLDENLSAVLNVPQKAGLLIQRVNKDSFAEEMGLSGGFFQAEILDQKLWLGGDIILEILGEVCDSPHSLNAIKETIESMKVGQSIYLKVLRQGNILELKKTK